MEEDDKMDNEDQTIKCKVVLLGKSGVGKTSIISRYTTNVFKESLMTTPGANFITKKVNFPKANKTVRIQIWDTAGQESFRSITRSYYKNSTCAFIVYDITYKRSFDNVIIWLKECKDLCYKNILICLVGNKLDLEDKRQVSYEEGKNFADENDLLFFETSARDGNNIKEIFMESANLLVDKIEKGEIKLENTDNGIKINKDDDEEEYIIKVKNKKKCC